MGGNDNDANKSLLEIAQHHGKSLISLMLDIQKIKLREDKLLSFIRNLECLTPEDHQPTFLSRRWINAFGNHGYVALSHTWNASKYEDSDEGKYKIQSRDRAKFYPSKVRNCTLDRVLKYMNKFQVSLLWVDKHSIRQRTCRQLKCAHRRCMQKQYGVQTMDLVYTLSKHPIALIAKPVNTSAELALLAKILSGKFVFRNQRTRCFHFSKEITRSEATMAVLFLKEMTSDGWWKRAWIFQESYCAGTALTLLIPHHPTLETQKRLYNINTFGDLDGELCISAVKFSYEATRVCLAFENIQSVTKGESDAISHIRTRSGRYSILLGKHESMTPVIVADIEKRDVNLHRDRLAIVANCCQYPVRLDVKKLVRKGLSISMAMLTMCLLNGEILCNKDAHGSLAQMTASEFLRNQCFKGFYAPEGLRSLSFNKRCRFIHSRLTMDGVFTIGHIWHLGRVICSHVLQNEPSWIEESAGKLVLHERKRLTQLANVLRSLGHFPLERRIKDYLQRRSCLLLEDGIYPETFAESYMRTMASELVHAIDCGKAIRLGSLWNSSRKPSPYRAIFIWDCDDDRTDECHKRPVSSKTSRPCLVFTASRPEIQPSDRHNPNDVDRHVSLAVRHEGFVTDRGTVVPRLFIDRWILGLCFLEGCPRMAANFPWPPGFGEIGS